MVQRNRQERSQPRKLEYRAGQYWLVGAENQDTTLIKLDKNTGNILIKNTINLGGSDAIEHLIEQDGKLYAVGYKNAQEPNNTFFTEGEGLIMRFDRTGVLEKTQSLSGHLAQGYRIAAHKGNFIVAGLTPYQQSPKAEKGYISTV